MDALGIHDFGIFVVAGLLLNITPGVDFLYVLSRGVTRGVRAGVWASLGIGLGCCVHIVAAALGLSAILATSAAAFTAVKWIGVAYLVYLGISMLRQRGGLRDLQLTQPTQDSMTRIFWQGFLTNVLNPKVALFFLAFLPQFIDPASPAKVAAFLTLGTVFNTTGTLWNIFVAWAAAFVAARLQAASRVGLWLNRCLGSMFIALGIRLAATTQRG
ncbi:MAG TPA: LysE family translocator [Steroidobacteraceae bacterium]